MWIVTQHYVFSKDEMQDFNHDISIFYQVIGSHFTVKIFFFWYGCAAVYGHLNTRETRAICLNTCTDGSTSIYMKYAYNDYSDEYSQLVFLSCEYYFLNSSSFVEFY